MPPANPSRQPARGKPILCALLAVIQFSIDANAENVAPIERALAGTLLDESKFSITRIRGGPASAEALFSQEYPANSTEVLAHGLDINGDGVEDHTVASYRNSLCGTGGCPYVLLDGRSGREIGSFFGSVAVLTAKVNGYAVIQVIGKRSIDSSSLTTHVYDRGSYHLVSYSILQAEGVREWRRTLDAK